MKKAHVLIVLSLLVSLFIYAFYRTERTLVNGLIMQLILAERYLRLKALVVHALPLSDIVIYSLPEGLWIFCITLTSKPYFLNLNGWRIDGVYVPLLFCISLELLQLIHVTNGRFDFNDIAVSFLFWLVARYGLGGSPKKQPMLARVNLNSLICWSSYGIVYLAHVYNKIHL